MTRTVARLASVEIAALVDEFGEVCGRSRAEAGYTRVSTGFDGDSFEPPADPFVTLSLPAPPFHQSAMLDKGYGRVRLDGLRPGPGRPTVQWKPAERICKPAIATFGSGLPERNTVGSAAAVLPVLCSS